MHKVEITQDHHVTIHHTSPTPGYRTLPGTVVGMGPAELAYLDLQARRWSNNAIKYTSPVFSKVMCEYQLVQLTKVIFSNKTLKT